MKHRLIGSSAYRSIGSSNRVMAGCCFAAALVAMAVAATSGQQAQEGQAFRFRTGVELINVTATVTDASGRFVAGLQKEDFRVYQDDQLQPISHFNAARVPVSLGIVLDTSGSMDGE